MASERAISVFGLLTIVVGVAVVASAFYDLGDPNFCAVRCGIIGNAFSRLMGGLNSITGPWGPRAVFLTIGVLLIVLGFRRRVIRRKVNADAI